MGLQLTPGLFVAETFELIFSKCAPPKYPNTSVDIIKYKKRSLCLCSLNNFTAVYNARNTPGENTAILMLLWCYIYNFIQNHNHCRDLHQIFSCLFETFGTMSEMMFSSDSMSKRYFFNS